MPQGQLSQVLGGAFDRTDERLLVGSESVDDAGVVALAVRVGLSGLLRMGGESFLPLAEELLRGAGDAELREAVLQAIAP